jgi:citrate lyase subunit beta/citryl-CoA lyase
MSEQETINDADPTEIGSRIDPVLARSWLLVNGAQPE